jgi:hypothetical protein
MQNLDHLRNGGLVGDPESSQVLVTGESGVIGRRVVRLATVWPEFAEAEE